MLLPAISHLFLPAISSHFSHQIILKSNDKIWRVQKAKPKPNKSHISTKIQGPRTTKTNTTMTSIDDEHYDLPPTEATIVTILLSRSATTGK